MNAKVISAIFRRNFNAYFANPTGYVFICVFVLLSSFAAFWPNEFFNANLANLDQLNKYLPYILLVFIPAITMSIWAEERRQGTDELLLTLPAGDFDVVLGKYLAAVAIFTVALVFSCICNFVVLLTLGQPDAGLFAATYLGYWFVGLAMLAIGMVASFLTGNLTVGFVLGALFNAPLAFVAQADVILPAQYAESMKGWSLEDQFRDFGRGVVSFSSAAYFVLIMCAMLYLCMVLIGRRHWTGGRDGRTLGGHYLVRAIALIVAAIGVILVAERFDMRADITSERLSSLSPNTRTLVTDLSPQYPVVIDAYISPVVPESYVETRLNLLSTLREFQALGSDKLQVNIHETEPLSDEADLAEKRFSIVSRQVPSRSRGALKFEDIYLGMAFTSGLNKVVVPFVDRGVPVEYEIARSISTISQQKRKRVGVLATDAQMMGGFNAQSMSPTREQPLIEELKKQYEVVQVNADAPITDRFDVLLAVQPSSLAPEQMENFIAAVKSGQPTAIFEDPFPFFDRALTATSAPKQQANPMMGMMGGAPPGPKGDINRLWNLLGISFADSEIVWQEYNPYKKFEEFPPEFVFIDAGAGAESEELFSETQPITSGLQQLLFLFPGSVSKLNTSPLKFERLVSTGETTGTVSFGEIMTPAMFGGMGGGLNPRRAFIPTRDKYTLAAHIHGQLRQAEPEVTDTADKSGEVPAADEAAKDAKSDEKSAEAAKADTKPAADKGPPEINVVLVADVDLLYPEFFMLREQGEDPEREINFDFDNVSFVLNVLDSLAADDRFIEIRKRRPRHRPLETIELLTQQGREDNLEQRKKFRDEFLTKKAELEGKLNKQLEKFKNDPNLDTKAKLTQVAMLEMYGNQTMQADIQRLEKERDQNIKRIDADMEREKQAVQDRYKLWAVILPPIPPLLVGLGVFFGRRSKEREGVARSRLR